MPIGAATSGTACRPGATILDAGAKSTAGCRMSAAGSRRGATEAGALFFVGDNLPGGGGARPGLAGHLLGGLPADVAILLLEFQRPEPREADAAHRLVPRGLRHPVLDAAQPDAARVPVSGRGHHWRGTPWPRGARQTLPHADTPRAASARAGPPGRGPCTRNSAPRAAGGGTGTAGIREAGPKRSRLTPRRG